MKLRSLHNLQFKPAECFLRSERRSGGLLTLTQSKVTKKQTTSRKFFNLIMSFTSVKHICFLLVNGAKKNFDEVIL